jgi:hypothetical protein
MSERHGVRLWVDYPLYYAGSTLRADRLSVAATAGAMGIVPKEHRPREWPRPDAQANALEAARRRREGRPVLVTCWCERTTVQVTTRDVREGRTASCGKPRCHP